MTDVQDLQQGIEALQRRWAELEAEVENLRAVLAALILREGGESLALSAEDVQRAGYWHATKGIRIQTLQSEPPLTYRVDLLPIED